MFIQSGTFNGKPLKGPWITHDEIMKGGTLELTMGAAPHRAWGSDPSAFHRLCLQSEISGA